MILIATAIPIYLYVPILVGGVAWKMVGWVILAIVGVSLLVWLLWSPTRRGYAGTVTQSNWFRWPAGAAVLLLLAYWYFPRSTVSGSVAGLVPTPVVTSINGLPADIVLPIIADCESGDGSAGSGRQLKADGNVVFGPTDDIGKWQIHLPTHWDDVERLGIDLWTEDGNEQYARLLYGKNEMADWEASRDCWEPKLAGLINSTDVIRLVVHTGQPVHGVIHQGWQMDYWVNLDQVIPATPVWSGRDRIQVFTTKAGVEQAEVRFRIYPCSAEAPCSAL